MASQVLSGSSNFTYTNTTGGNVRVIINYMASNNFPMVMSWTATSGGLVSISAYYPLAIGRNLATAGGLTQYSGLYAQNATAIDSYELANFALPTEIMLEDNQVFSVNCGAYNIVVIPEAG